jgi:hypothetical protein
MLSFALYVVGSVVAIAGLAWIATLLGAAAVYVTAGAGLLFALAIVAAAVQRRMLQPPAA